MYYIYVLQLSTGEFYKGLTANLLRRISEHSLGKVDSTRKKLPFTLIHVEICDTRQEARKLEKYFKSGFGREIISEFADVAKWQTRTL